MGKDKLDALSERVIGAAIAVHRELGPGLLEHCYQACLEFELTRQGFKVDREVPVPVIYGGVKVDCGFRIDLLVNDAIILELEIGRTNRQSAPETTADVSETRRQTTRLVDELQHQNPC